MRILLDTNLLLRLAHWPERLSCEAAKIIGDASVQLVLGAVSIWKAAVKRALGRADVELEPLRLRRSALDIGFEGWPVSSLDGAAVADLPPIHNDPFDGLLLAQAKHEGVMLLTTDTLVATYPVPVRLV